MDNTSDSGRMVDGAVSRLQFWATAYLLQRQTISLTKYKLATLSDDLVGQVPTMLITSQSISRLRRWPKHHLILGLQNYCKDSEDIEINKKSEDDEAKRKLEAKKRMQDLLLSLKKGSFVTKSPDPVKLARPKPLLNKKSQTSPTIDPHMKKAVEKVAKTLKGDPEQTKSELLKAVEEMNTQRDDLSNVLMSMKVSKESQEPADFKFAPKSRLGEFRPRMDEFRSAPSIKLFSSRPLGIFPADLKPSDASKSSVLNIWDSALDREKAIAITRYPRHYFEELIQWTEQRKLWPFPIDNEMGMEEEKSYTFADHIFLERHLKEWCPTRGPVRHFMELVCVGLSKNHYMTVPRKLAHIEWFRSFLQSKEEILKETGAI